MSGHDFNASRQNRLLEYIPRWTRATDARVEVGVRSTRGLSAQARIQHARPAVSKRPTPVLVHIRKTVFTTIDIVRPSVTLCNATNVAIGVNQCRQKATSRD